jgi:hypothetical protein
MCGLYYGMTKLKELEDQKDLNSHGIRELQFCNIIQRNSWWNSYMRLQDYIVRRMV